MKVNYRLLLYITIFAAFVSCQSKKKQEPVNIVESDTLSLVHPNIKMPKVIEKPNIDYPEEVLAIKKRVIVYVNAEIDKHGNIHNVKVIKSPDSLLNKYAIELAYKFKFEPGKIDGVPTDLTIAWPIEFKLKK